MVFDGRFGAGLDGSGETSFENVEAHDVAHGVVKNKGEEVKIDDAMKTLRQIVKKSGEVPMLGDGFRYFEQGFELTPGVFERRWGHYFGRGNNGIRHRKQDSIVVGRGSTEGAFGQRSVPHLGGRGGGNTATNDAFREALHFLELRAELQKNEIDARGFKLGEPLCNLLRCAYQA
jgi:hypothetical protein